MAAVHAPPDSDRDDRRGEPASPGGARRRPLRDRLSAGHWLILLAGTLAATLNFAILHGGDEQVAIAFATTTIVPGQIVTDADIRVTHVEAGDLIAARFVAAGDVDGLLGGVATTRVSAGDPLPRSAIVPRDGADLLRTMSLPIDPAHAVGGELRAGDRVDVITVVDGRARYIAADVEVVAVADRDGGGALGANLAGYHVVLAVDPATALHLAVAVQAGGIEVIRSTGAPALTDAGIEVGDPVADDRDDREVSEDGPAAGGGAAAVPSSGEPEPGFDGGDDR